MGNIEEVITMRGIDMDIVYDVSYNIYLNGVYKGNLKPNENGRIAIPKEWTNEVGSVKIVPVYDGEEV